MKPLVSAICVHDDHYFLEAAIKSFLPAGGVVCFLSRRGWTGADGDWERAAKVAEKAGAEVVVGDWPDESLHRRAALSEMKSRGHRYCFIPDGDEVIEPKLLAALVSVAKEGLAERAYVHMDTYWKSPEYVIRPRENLAPIIMLDLEQVEHHYIRDYRGGRQLTLSAEHGVLHHLSYAGPDERIWKKITSWGHRHEVASDWFERVWRDWDRNILMRDLHSTHPQAYGWAERITPPEPLSGIPGLERPAVLPPEHWPTVSIVIPLHGGREDIDRCLASLAKCQDLLHEVIVVDDTSPDDAPEAVASYPFSTLLTNEKNLGFAGTCNKGFEASTGEIVVFLNSDTAVPRAGLIRMIEALVNEPGAAASGPVTNACGHHQLIPVTFTAMENMELFAEDLAQRGSAPFEVDMLVGFCVAIRRSALEAIGTFDERFGTGMFEDNDLAYRLRREGHSLLVVPQAYVFHRGHQSLNRREEHPVLLLQRNEEIFKKKWAKDLEYGFASHLPGFASEPIRFDHSRRPDVVRSQLKELSRKADISLCMIVKNEERVLGECLDSVQGVFREIIVVDTGSTDRTTEIATEHGAQVYDFPWTDSFSEARNVSLTHAKGKWIFWMDADDTLPIRSAEAILDAAIKLPKEITGAIVPVRFASDSRAGNTQVDHVKLVRNLPGIEFEGHIHEQIIPSLSKLGGGICRIDAVVMHTGYDSTPEGQAKKFERDWKLLKLDLDADPEHPFYNFNMGMTCHYAGQHEEAISWLMRSIMYSTPETSFRRKAYALIGISHRELGRVVDAIAVFDHGIQEAGHDPELFFQMGLTFASLGKYEEAHRCYVQVPGDISGHYSSVDISIFGSKLFHNLGVVCQEMGRTAEARSWFQRAVEDGFLPSAEVLTASALQQGDIVAATEAHHSLYRLGGPSDAWTALGIQITERQGQDPLLFLEGYLQRAPYSVEPKLAMSRMLLARGRFSEAADHLRDLMRMNIAEAAYHLGVLEARMERFDTALSYMERAALLNPFSFETRNQLASLREVVASKN